MKRSNYLALGFSREVTVRNEFQMALVASYMIGYVHLATLVDPQLADDDVVHRRRHFTPSVMVTWYDKQDKTISQLNRF